jgi:iron complex transport system substrate-binding protein
MKNLTRRQRLVLAMRNRVHSMLKQTSRLASTILVLWIFAGSIGSMTEGIAQSSYPRSFTDAGGNQVTLNAKPMRIASVALGIDETLLDLVDPPRIVAMTQLSIEPYVSNVADRVPDNTVLIVDEWERVIDAKPDLILVTTYTQPLADRLIGHGIPVYQFSDFSSIEALFRNLEILGELVGEEKRAEEILNRRRDQLARSSNRESDDPIRAVYFSEGSLYTGGTVPSGVIAAAGLVDAAAEFGLSGRIKASAQLIANLRPDLIIICESSEETEKATRALFQTPAYQVISAARAGQIHVIPGKHMTASHYIVDAVEALQVFATKNFKGR